MAQLAKMSIDRQQANIVVPATALGDLESITRTPLAEAPWDLVEARLDLLASVPPELVAKSLSPILLTARHPAEGGAAGFTDPGARSAVLAPLIPHAVGLDIEIAHAGAMSGTLDEARAAGLCIVLSFHDFTATPDAARLDQIVAEGIASGADIVKLATRTESAGDVARLIDLLERFPEQPLSVMGMGPLGMASRLLAAGCGSALNYASHGAATVDGQWPAAEFHALLERTGART